MNRAHSTAPSRVGGTTTASHSSGFGGVGGMGPSSLYNRTSYQTASSSSTYGTTPRDTYGHASGTRASRPVEPVANRGTYHHGSGTSSYEGYPHHSTTATGTSSIGGFLPDARHAVRANSPAVSRVSSMLPSAGSGGTGIRGSGSRPLPSGYATGEASSSSAFSRRSVTSTEFDDVDRRNGADSALRGYSSRSTVAAPGMSSMSGRRDEFDADDRDDRQFRDSSTSNLPYAGSKSSASSSLARDAFDDVAGARGRRDSASGALLSASTSHYGSTPSTTAYRPAPPAPPQLSSSSMSAASVIPKGLRNMGNTCYMNAALQCLLHGSGSFVDQLESARAAGRRSTSLRDSFVSLKSSSGTQALLGVKTGVSRMNSEFIGTRQNDSHEFIRELLHGIHKELNRIEGTPKYVEMKDIEGESDTAAADRWIRYSQSHDDSVVYDHFGGFVRSVTKCGSCANRTFVFDPFLDLSINPNANLVTAIGNINTMEDVQVFKCEKCKGKNIASRRQTVVVRWPRTLVVHLKRFSASGRKDGASVAFPTAISPRDAETFIMPQGTKFPPEGYSLSGIVLHHGQMGYGHYTAYVRPLGSSGWYECDDGVVSSVTESTVLRATTAAYLLFYSTER